MALPDIIAVSKDLPIDSLLKRAKEDLAAGKALSQDVLESNLLEKLSSLLRGGSNLEQLQAGLELLFALEKSVHEHYRDKPRMEQLRGAIIMLISDISNGGRLRESSLTERHCLTAIAIRCYGSLSVQQIRADTQLLQDAGWFDATCTTLMFPTAVTVSKNRSEKGLLPTPLYHSEISQTVLNFFEQLFQLILSPDVNSSTARDSHSHSHSHSHNLVKVVCSALVEHRLSTYILNTMEVARGDARIQIKALDVLRVAMETADAYSPDMSAKFVPVEQHDRLVRMIDALTNVQCSSLSIIEIGSTCTACLRLLAVLIRQRLEISDTLVELSGSKAISRIPERLVEMLGWLANAHCTASSDECIVALLDCLSELTRNREARIMLTRTNLGANLVDLLPYRVTCAREDVLGKKPLELEAFVGSTHVRIVASALRCLRSLVSFSERDKNAAITDDKVAQSVARWFLFVLGLSAELPAVAVSENLLETVAFFACFLEVPCVKSTCLFLGVHGKVIELAAKFCFDAQLTQTVLDYFVAMLSCNANDQLVQPSIGTDLESLIGVLLDIFALYKERRDDWGATVLILTQIVTMMQISVRGLVALFDRGVCMESVMDVVSHCLLLVELDRPDWVSECRHVSKLHVETCVFVSLMAAECAKAKDASDSDSDSDSLVRERLGNQLLERAICPLMFDIATLYHRGSNEAEIWVVQQTITDAFLKTVTHRSEFSDHLLFDASSHCHFELAQALIDSVKAKPVRRSGRSRSITVKVDREMRSELRDDVVAACTIYRTTDYAGRLIDEAVALRTAQLMLMNFSDCSKTERLNKIIQRSIRRGEHAIVSLLVCYCKARFNKELRIFTMRDCEISELRPEWLCRIAFGDNGICVVQREREREREQDDQKQVDTQQMGQVHTTLRRLSNSRNGPVGNRGSLPLTLLENDVEGNGQFRATLCGTVLPFDERDFRYGSLQLPNIAALTTMRRDSSEQTRRRTPTVPTTVASTVLTAIRDRRSGTTRRSSPQVRGLVSVKLRNYIIEYDPRSGNKHIIKKMDLSGNRLTDFNCLADLAHVDSAVLVQLFADLEELICSGNVFERVPPILFRCPLQYNETPISTNSCPCANLKTLVFSNNKLAEFPIDVTLCGRLKRLDLSNNALTSSALTPNEAAAISGSLAELILDYNRLTVYPSAFIHRHVPDLQVLSAKGNSISDFQSVRDTDLPFQRRLVNLVKLNLSDNKLTVIPSELLAELPKLEELDLSGNDLSQPNALPSSSALRGAVPRLHTLNFSRCKLREVPKFVLELRKLKVLDLSHNRLSRLPPIATFSSDCLRDLDVQCNDLVVVNFKQASQWSLLRRLVMNDNKLTDLPPEIGLFAELERLDLSRNPLTVLPLELCRLKKLASLMLEDVHPRNVPAELTKPGKHEDLQTFLERQYKANNYYYGMKLFVIGNRLSGKTTFLDNLVNASSEKLPIVKDNADSQRSRGSRIFDWKIALRLPTGESVPYTFSCWDFADCEFEFSSNFFDKRAVYFVMYDLTNGVCEAEQVCTMLRHIHQATPKLPPLTFLIGTHLDQVMPDIRSSISETMRERFTSIIPSAIKVSEIFSINAHSANDIDRVRKALLEAVPNYRHRSEVCLYKVVPTCFLDLNAFLTRYREVRGANAQSKSIFRRREMLIFIRETISPHSELLSNGLMLQQAIKFLHNIGTLIHFEDSVGRLNDLFFVEPQKLVEDMTRIAKELRKAQKNGFTDRMTLHQLLQKVGVARAETLVPFERLCSKFDLLIHYARWSEKFLVPSSLRFSAPTQLREFVESNVSSSLTRRRYVLEFLPPRFAMRAIAKLLTTLKASGQSLNERMECVWQKGVALFESSNTFVLVEMIGGEPGEPDSVDIVAGGKCATLFAKAISCLDSVIEEQFPFLKDDDPLSDALQSEEGSNTPGSVLAACNRCPKKSTNWFQLRVLFNQSAITDKVRCSRCGKSVLIEHIAPDFYFADLRDKSGKCKYLNLRLDDTVLLGDGLCVDLKNTPLGRGGFGVVFSGKLAGHETAVKLFIAQPSGDVSSEHHVPKQLLSRLAGKVGHEKDDNEQWASKQDELAYRELRKELAVLNRCGPHPSLVEALGFSLRPKLLVLEYARFGSLGSFLRDARKMRTIATFGMLTRLALQVADGLRFLHSHNVVYRDLKPDNVLVVSISMRDAVNAKLTDFGIAQECAESDALTRPLGTPGFRAPEVIQGNAYSGAADVYSFGVLLHAMVNAGRIPADDIAMSDLEMDHVAVIDAGRRSSVDSALQSFTVTTGRNVTRRDVIEYFAHSPFQLVTGAQPQSPLATSGAQGTSTGEVQKELEKLNRNTLSTTLELISWPGMDSLSSRCRLTMASERPSAAQLFDTLRRSDFCALRHMIPIHLQCSIDCVSVRVTTADELSFCVSSSYEEFGTHLSWIRFNLRTNAVHMQADVLQVLLKQAQQQQRITPHRNMARASSRNHHQNTHEHVLCMAVCNSPKATLLLGCGDAKRHGRVLILDEQKRSVESSRLVESGMVVCLQVLNSVVLAGLDSGHIWCMSLFKMLRGEGNAQLIKLGSSDEPVKCIEHVGRLLVVACGNKLHLLGWNKAQLQVGNVSTESLRETPLASVEVLAATRYSNCAQDVQIRQIVAVNIDGSTHLLIAYRAQRHSPETLERAHTLDVWQLNKLSNSVNLVTHVDLLEAYTSVNASDYADDGRVEDPEKVRRSLRITTLHCDTLRTGTLLVGTSGGYLFAFTLASILRSSAMPPLIVKRYNGPIQFINHVRLTKRSMFEADGNLMPLNSRNVGSIEEPGMHEPLQSCFLVAGEMFAASSRYDFASYSSSAFGSQPEDDLADGSGAITVWADDLLQQRDAMAEHLVKRNVLFNSGASSQ